MPERLQSRKFPAVGNGDGRRRKRVLSDCLLQNRKRPPEDRALLCVSGSWWAHRHARARFQERLTEKARSWVITNLPGPVKPRSWHKWHSPQEFLEEPGSGCVKSKHSRTQQSEASLAQFPSSFGCLHTVADLFRRRSFQA